VLIVAVVSLAGGLGYVTGDSSDDNHRGAQLWEALVTGNLSPQVACGRTCRPPTGTLARATECPFWCFAARPQPTPTAAIAAWGALVERQSRATRPQPSQSITW
jgi:hypothetical protein